MSDLTERTDVELLAAGLTARFSGEDTGDLMAEALRRVKEQYGLVEATDEQARLQQHRIQSNLDEIRRHCRELTDRVAYIYDELDEIQEELDS